MARGRWKISSEKVATEAFLVLIKREKASKTYSKSKLHQLLAHPETRAAFLKLCLEYDDTESLIQFRHGLLLAIKALGPSKFARNLGVNRISIYRMLGKQGNPSLRYIARVLGSLGLRLWSLEEDFFLRRERLERPKHIAKDLDAFEIWLGEYRRGSESIIADADSPEVEEDES